MEGSPIPAPRPHLIGCTNFIEDFRKRLAEKTCGKRLQSLSFFNRSNNVAGNVFFVFGTHSGKTEIVKSVCTGASSRKARPLGFSWMRRTVDFDVQCFVDLRDRVHCPQLSASESKDESRVEDLSVAILDGFGKGYLYTIDDHHVSATTRLQQLLSHESHESKRKLIVVSHADWIFDDDSLRARENFEAFANSVTRTNTTIIFTICSAPKSHFLEKVPNVCFLVRRPALDEPRQGLCSHLENRLSEFHEEEHLELFKRILALSNFKMELLDVITNEIVERSNFDMAFDMLTYLKDLTTCINIKEMAGKLTENFTADERKLTHFLRLYPLYFRFDDCLCIKGYDDDLTEEKLKRSLTNLFQKGFVRQAKPGMFALSDLLRETIDFSQVPADIKKIFIINVLQSLSEPMQQMDPYMVASQRRNWRSALAMMDLETPICFTEPKAIREVVLQIGVENFPSILENMRNHLGKRFFDFFKNIVKRCEEGIEEGSVEEAWLKVVLKSFAGPRQPTTSIDPVLVICFEKYMSIAERVRDSGEEEWEGLTAELEGVKREMVSCEEIDKEYVTKLNTQIDPLLRQLRCFPGIYGDINGTIDAIRKEEADISSAAEQRSIGKKIQNGVNSSCNLLKEAAIELKVLAELNVKTLAGNEEMKRARQAAEIEKRDCVAVVETEMANLRKKLEEKEAEWRQEQKELETKGQELIRLNQLLSREVTELQRKLIQKQEEINKIDADREAEMTWRMKAEEALRRLEEKEKVRRKKEEAKVKSKEKAKKKKEKAEEREGGKLKNRGGLLPPLPSKFYGHVAVRRTIKKAKK